VSRLFINLYLDEDVDVLVARLIRSRAFSVLTTHEANQTGKSDAEQLDFAAKNRLAILTHNRADFEKLARQYVSTGQHHSGIFIAVRRSPYELARRILVLLNEITADEMDNQVLYI
jgi:uncharacterized protein YbgA (DUF1722 family)